MKNVLMTAVALVAFSAASMANTKEVKVAVEPVKEVKTESEFKRSPCDQLWIDMYNFGISGGNPGGALEAGSGAAWAYAEAGFLSHGCRN